MIRLIAAAALGWVAYRVGREFIRDIPAGFEPIPEAGPRRAARRPAAKTSRAARATQKRDDITKERPQ
jgi:hypothetical protein